MSRIKGVTKGGSLLYRFSQFYAKRKYGKVLKPVQVQGLSTPVMWGVGQMELSVEMMKKLPGSIQMLVEIRAATLIGCPF